MTSLQSTSTATSGTSTPSRIRIDGDPIPRTREGRKYRIVTREYMAQGHDGFLALKGQRYLVDDESGQMMSAIVRKYLLGCRYVNRMSRLGSQVQIDTLHPDTPKLIAQEKARREHYESGTKTKTAPERHPQHQHSAGFANKVRHAARTAIRWSRAHYRDHIHVTQREHMSGVDTFDGKGVRTGAIRKTWETTNQDEDEDNEEDLPVIHPIVDGRLKDEGRP